MIPGIGAKEETTKKGAAGGGGGVIFGAKNWVFFLPFVALLYLFFYR